MSDYIQPGWSRSAPTSPCRLYVRRVNGYLMDRFRGDPVTDHGEALVAWHHEIEVYEMGGDLWARDPNYDPFSGGVECVPVRDLAASRGVEWCRYGSGALVEAKAT